MSPLIWTTEIPTVPGAYWIKNSNISCMSDGIVWVTSEDEYSFDEYTGEHLEVTFDGGKRALNVDEVEAQWAGPIEEPIDNTTSNGTKMMPLKDFLNASPAIQMHFVTKTHGRVIR